MTLPPEFHELAKKVNNWGRWGPGDERGTLNLITDPVVQRAASCIKTGRQFSLAVPLGPEGPMMGNVPGPPFPLYFGGAKLVAMYPLGPVFHGAALNMTVVSYQDIVCWGMIAGRESLPGLWDLAAAIPDALAELRKVADAVIHED